MTAADRRRGGPPARRPPLVLLSGPQRGGQPRGPRRGGARDAAVARRHFEIIAVDDGSKDRTGEIADRLAAAHPDVVRVVHHDVNRGYGGALRSGFEASRYDLLAFTDGDRQFRVADLGRLTARLAGPDRPDVVVGYRIKRADPLIRIAYARTYKLANRLFFGLRVRDVDCACKLFRREALEDVRVESGGAFFSAELLIKIESGRSIVEVGVPHYPRTAGSPTGREPWVIWRAVKDFWGCGCGCGRTATGTASAAGRSSALARQPARSPAGPARPRARPRRRASSRTRGRCRARGIDLLARHLERGRRRRRPRSRRPRPSPRPRPRRRRAEPPPAPGRPPRRRSGPRGGRRARSRPTAGRPPRAGCRAAPSTRRAWNVSSASAEMITPLHAHAELRERRREQVVREGALRGEALEAHGDGARLPGADPDRQVPARGPTSLRITTWRPERMWTRTLSTTISISVTRSPAMAGLSHAAGPRGPCARGGRWLASQVRPNAAARRNFFFFFKKKKKKKKNIHAVAPTKNTVAEPLSHRKGSASSARHEPADVGEERDAAVHPRRRPPASPARRSPGGRTRSPAR